MLKRGNFFGEGALIQANQKRNATVRAITYCDLFALTRPNFETVLRRFPRFRMQIIETSKARARAAETVAPASVAQAALAPGGGASPAGSGPFPAVAGQSDGAATATSPTAFQRGQSFLHERLAAQDELEARIARAKEECEEVCAGCLNTIDQMEALVSDLNRQQPGRNPAAAGRMGSGSGHIDAMGRREMSELSLLPEASPSARNL